MPKSKTPKLTPKQKKFCEAYVTNSGNGAAAARAAGYKGSEDSIRQQAFENLTKPNISEYIAELRKKIEVEFEVTAREVVTALRERGNRAFENEDFSAAIRATELLGKTIGIFVDKKEVTVTPNLEELADRVAEHYKDLK